MRGKGKMVEGWEERKFLLSVRCQQQDPASQRIPLLPGPTERERASTHFLPRSQSGHRRYSKTSAASTLGSSPRSWPRCRRCCERDASAGQIAAGEKR